jgi:hypothetical protein
MAVNLKGGKFVAGERSGPFEQHPTGRAREGVRRDLDVLTRAEARALSRSAPLTPEEFRERRRIAEQGYAPLRAVLGGADMREPPSQGGR